MPTLPLPDGSRWRAGWPTILLSLAAALAFARLGMWQWTRGVQQQALVRAAARPEWYRPATAEQFARLARFAHVQVRGTYDSAHQFLLENISHGGQPGYDVLTPLHLDSGPTVLVNRGWVGLGASRAQPPSVDFAGGAHTVSGRWEPLPIAAIAMGHGAPAGAWPKLASFPVIDELSTTLGTPLLPWTVLLDAGEPDGYARDWQPGGLPPARHYAYAVQWWAFSLLTLGLLVGLNRRTA